MVCTEVGRRGSYVQSWKCEREYLEVRACTARGKKRASSRDGVAPAGIPTHRAAVPNIPRHRSTAPKHAANIAVWPKSPVAQRLVERPGPCTEEHPVHIRDVLDRPISQRLVERPGVSEHLAHICLLYTSPSPRDS